jgi:hypothetical protein
MVTKRTNGEGFIPTIYSSKKNWGWLTRSSLVTACLHAFIKKLFTGVNKKLFVFTSCLHAFFKSHTLGKETMCGKYRSYFECFSKERLLGIYFLPYPGLILSIYHFYTLYKERTALAFRERHICRETDILNELIQRIYPGKPLACYADVC